MVDRTFERQKKKSLQQPGAFSCTNSLYALAYYDQCLVTCLSAAQMVSNDVLNGRLS